MALHPINDHAEAHTRFGWQIRGLESTLSDVKNRLKNARSINRRVRLGKQMNSLTARILALKLAHSP